MDSSTAQTILSPLQKSKHHSTLRKLAGMESRSPSEAGSVGSFESEDTYLCGICQRIDFDKYLGKKISKPITLGTWANLIFRSKNGCSFCRLVVHCLACRENYTPKELYVEVFLDNKASSELGIEQCPFDRKRSDTCSNKFDLRDRERECGQTAFRFLVSAKGSHENDKAQIQYLAHMEKTDNARQFFGRKIYQDKIDTPLLESWLNLCRKHHGRECDTVTVSGKLPVDFRLVDLDRGSIVRAPRNQEYVALSYVWGAERMAKFGMQPALLTSRNLRIFRGKESTPLPSKLPRTIKDAAWLTKALGFRYLWVDALCVVQDESYANKAIHLTHMPAIFARAALTIAAAAGKHADYGLPGISKPRKFAQTTKQVGGLRLASMFPSFSELQNSKDLVWNRRGWTLQEKLLSKRILLFTDYQVYFKCSECIWTEEVLMETEQLSKERVVGKYRWPPPNQRLNPPDNSNGLRKFLAKDRKISVDDELTRVSTLQNYADMVNELATRNFTDCRDVLFALNGILTILDSMTPTDSPKGFLFALPEAHFLDSLMWLPEVGVIQTKAPTVHNIIPSWSWAAWEFRNQRGAYYDIKSDCGIRELSLHFYDLVHSPDSLRWFRANKTLHVFQKVLQQCLELPSRLEGITLTQMNLVQAGQNRIMELEDPMKFVSQIIPSVTNKMSSLWDSIPVPAPNPQLIKATTSKIDQIMAIAPKRGTFTRGQAAIEETYRALSRPISSKAHSPAALVFRTSVVKFRIGAAIIPKRYETRHDDETGIFELLNGSNQCVGELHTTFGVARSRGGKLADFLTISWGFGVRNANVHERLVPSWTISLGGPRWAAEPSAEAVEQKRRQTMVLKKTAVEKPVVKRSMSMSNKPVLMRKGSTIGGKPLFSERHSTGELSSRSHSRPPVSTRRYSGSTYRPAMSERHSAPEIPWTTSYPPVSIRRYKPSLTSRSSSYQPSNASRSGSRRSSSTTRVGSSSGSKRLGSVLEGTTLAGDLDQTEDFFEPKAPEPSLYDAVNGARKGDRMPRQLWPAVNLILVHMNGGRATRLGIGKVVMSAWEEDRTPGQEVIFV